MIMTYCWLLCEKPRFGPLPIVSYWRVVYILIGCRYFGGYGIIRVVVHGHLRQTIALFPMEPPVSLDGEDIRNEKFSFLFLFKLPLPTRTTNS